MANAPNLLERAFELASTGRCATVDDIRRKLKSERFENVDGHLAGGQITGQLRGLIAVANARRAEKVG